MSNIIGTCQDAELIEDIFGSVSEFARLVEIYGNEFTYDDTIVKYDEDTDIHSFYCA